MGSLSLTFLLLFFLLAIPPMAEAKHHLPESAPCEPLSDDDCMSGYCWTDGTCSKPSRKLGKVGGGGACSQPHHCYSLACIVSVCCKEAEVEGSVGGGGCCYLDSQCYSGRCDNRNVMLGKCSLDSPVKGKVGDGGYCTLTSDCHSGVCDDKTKECSTDSAAVTKDQRNPDGSSCKVPDDCLSGYCHIKGVNDLVCANKRVQNKGTHGAYCEDNLECYSGHCAQRKCAIRPNSKVGEYCHYDFDCESLNCDPTAGKCLQASTIATDEGQHGVGHGQRRRRVKCDKDEHCFDHVGSRSVCDQGFCSGGDGKKTVGVMLMTMIGAWKALG